MGKYVDYYCQNNCKRLISLTNQIIKNKFGWIPEKDYDDFYSIAGQTLWMCEKNFDKSKETKFKTYFVSCLIKKFKSRITYCNRCKRKQKDKEGNPIPEISINFIVDEKNGYEIADTLVDKNNLLENILSIQDSFSDEFQIFFSQLTKKQQEIAILIMQDYTPIEIQRILGISNQRYQSQFQKIKSYKNIAILCQGREGKL